MLTLLIVGAATLALEIVTVILVWRRPLARKIMLGLILISLLFALLGWLTIIPLAMWGSYHYLSSFMGNELGLPSLLAKSIACLIALPILFGSYLTLRLRSSGWQRWVGMSLVLTTFAAIFFWGHLYQQQIKAQTQAEALRIQEGQKQAETARQQQQAEERQRAIAEVQARQAHAQAEQARAQTEKERLIAAAAAAETERVRLELEANARAEEARRQEVLRREARKQQLKKTERHSHHYSATRPLLIEEGEPSTSTITIPDNLEIYILKIDIQRKDNQSVTRSWLSKNNFQVELGTCTPIWIDGVCYKVETSSILPEGYCVEYKEGYQIPGNCPSVSKILTDFNGQSSQGEWKLTVEGDTGWIDSWSITITPTLDADGSVVRPAEQEKGSPSQSGARVAQDITQLPQ